MANEECTAYCETCDSHVLLVREEINVPLAIILAILGGFLVIIYMIIYHKKEPDRCIHCKSVIQTNEPNQLESGEGVKFCPICRVELDERTDVRFCALCGAELKN